MGQIVTQIVLVTYAGLLTPCKQLLTAYKFSGIVHFDAVRPVLIEKIDGLFRGCDSSGNSSMSIIYLETTFNIQYTTVTHN